MAWAAKKEVNISALIARPKSINLLGFWLEIKKLGRNCSVHVDDSIENDGAVKILSQKWCLHYGCLINDCHEGKKNLAQASV